MATPDSRFEEQNPYQAPTVDTAEGLGPTADGSQDAERIRRQYLNHEASVRSIGALYYLGGVILTVAVVKMGIVAFRHSLPPVELATFGFYVALTPLTFIASRALRKLNRRMRFVVGILSGIGLFSFSIGTLIDPIGVLINGYILYLVFGKKGTMIFSPKYQEIMRQTPHIKYRISPLAIVLLVIMTIVLLGILAWQNWTTPLDGKRSRIGQVPGEESKRGHRENNIPTQAWGTHPVDS